MRGRGKTAPPRYVPGRPLQRADRRGAVIASASDAIASASDDGGTTQGWADGDTDAWDRWPANESQRFRRATRPAFPRSAGRPLTSKRPRRRRSRTRTYRRPCPAAPEGSLGSRAWEASSGPHPREATPAPSRWRPDCEQPAIRHRPAASRRPKPAPQPHGDLVPRTRVRSAAGADWDLRGVAWIEDARQLNRTPYSLNRFVPEAGIPGPNMKLRSRR